MKINLETIQIARSCSTDWESMTGDEKTRFCTDCDKTVYNFAELTRREAETLLRETGGKICARIIKDADGFVVTANPPVGLNLIKFRASKFASALVTAAISLSSSVAAKPLERNSSNLVHQPSQNKKEATSNNATLDINQQGAKGMLKGTIFDMAQAVIVGAKIKITEVNAKFEITTYSADDGMFIFAGIPEGTYKIEVSCTGFVTSKLEGCELRGNLVVNLNLTLQVGTQGGPIYIGEEKIDQIDPSIIPSNLLKLIEPIKELINKPVKKKP